MIVLHRRGTTGEWRKADLMSEQLPDVLLKDGEFAIEERADGSRWVKIGDGKTKFSKLPYIDDRAISVLSDALTTTKKDVAKKIAELEAVGTSLSTDIKQNSSSITALQNKLELEVAAINTDVTGIATRTDDLLGTINTKAYELENKFNDDLSVAQRRAEKLIANTAEAHTADLLAAKASLAQQIAENAKTHIENLTRLRAELDSVDLQAAENLAQHIKQNNSLFTDILEQLTTLKEKTKQLSADDRSLVEIIYGVNNTLTAITTRLSNELSSLATKQETEHSAVLTSIKHNNDARVAAESEILASLTDYVTKIYAEIADLVDDDILILEKAFSVENTLSARISAIEKNVIADFGTVIDGKIEEAKTSLEAIINDSVNSLNENVEDLRSNTNLKTASIQKAIESLKTALLAANSALESQLSDLSTEVVTNKQEAIDAITAAEVKITAVNDRVDETNAELALHAKRIDNLISLDDGSTTGDAELIDIRSGYNGVTHASAGAAVRAIGEDLEALKNSLPDYIPSNAVDGLLYENNQLYLTSNGQTVGDPVEITGGSGGGGSVSTVRVTNNLPLNSFSIARGNAAWIDFTYTSFENEVSTGDGTVNVTINNKAIEALSGTVLHGVAKRIDVAEYLKTGSNTVKVTCSDQYGSSRSLVYNISVIELRIESYFDATRIFSDTITFRYKVYGQIEKYVNILIDGEEFSKNKLNASVSGNEITLVLPKQSHGCHKITAFVSAFVNDSEVQSNILEYEIICTEADNNAAMITSVYKVSEVTHGDLVSIPYMVYDPTKLEADVELIICSQVAGELIEIERLPVTVGRGLQYWNTRKYPEGKNIFTISYTYKLYGVETTITKSHTVVANAIDINVTAETDSLALYLSAQGRTNAEQNPAVWRFTPEAILGQPSDEITTTFENFNWRSNGWVVDDSGDTCLRLNGDARATINFKPFQEDFKLNGKTIEFEFAVRDVNDRDATVISCYSRERGFLATPDTAFMQSAGSKVSCNYKDNERIRVAVSVEHADSSSRFVSIYLDGILSGVQRYATTDNFSQENPVNITLGSSLCGLDLYTIRVYNKALSTAQVLTNYIADQADPTTKVKLFTDNDLLDENDNISYERVKALGQLPIVTFTGQMPTYKGDKKKKSVRMKFEDPANPELNFDVLLDQIDVQGTSSQFYIRKNWKVKLPEARQHMPGAIPAKVFCIKVDYAEATGTHNTGSANYIETLYDRNEVLLPPQKDDTRVRTTIQGFPCILFEKATEDSEPVFSSKGNFNYDKDAENAFGFTEDYDSFGVECWEFCNNTSDPVNFAGEIPDDWLEDFEPRYAPKSANFERIEELKEIEELAASGKGTMTAAQRTELATLMRDCIANFKEMHDWVCSTATYTLSNGKKVPIIPVPLAEPITYGETTYTEDNEEYRLAKFKYEFKNYFNMHYSSMYYVFTFFALMTDQRAKNLFLTRWKEDDGVYRWYPYFYDNDTIFGINNEGALVFDYFHEDTDQLGSSNVFNGQNSVLWHNYRLCFPKEIEDTYSALRSDGKLTYNKIIEQFVTNGSDKWSAAIYNADADYKYVSMAREAVEHKDEEGNVVTGIDASNLYQVRGPGEHHLRYFIANRLNYCDSKWYAGSYPKDDIFLRIYTPKAADDATQEEIDRINASLAAVPANPCITITPFSDMYAGVRYKSGTLQQQRVKAGESYTFGPLNQNETFGDTETAIYGAGEISSLGDLSGLYCGVINLSNARKLTELTIGNANPAYYNDNFREISVGANGLLRRIDLRNCSGLGIAGENPQKTLELSACPNIEEIYTEGTNLESIDLPESGYIKVLHLPASITTLNIKNQQYIEDFTIESYSNVRTLCIENCPTLDTNEILSACSTDGRYTVERVRLTGIDWTFDDASFVKSLFPEFDADGNIISGIRGIDEKNNNLDDAYLVGTCYINELSGADYSEIKQHYPYLELTFGKMTSNISFKYTDASGEYHEEAVLLTSIDSQLGNLTDYMTEYLPAWPENDAFTYEFVGWSRKYQISSGIADSESDYLSYIQADALIDIAGDRMLYPVFKAVRKSYPVTFINPTAPEGSQELLVTYTPYGYDAVYDGVTPTKQDGASPDIYEHIGWQPSPANITGPLTCYAQFTVLDEKWYTIVLGDIAEYVDNNGVVHAGYTINKANGTMTIIECVNDFNAAVRIPSSMDIDGETFEVISLKGFAKHNNLELIRLPNTLKTIAAAAFSECRKLYEVALPSELTTIQDEAFKECNKIKAIHIPAYVSSIGKAAFMACPLTSLTVAEENSVYEMIDDCLLNGKGTSTGRTLIKGLSTGIIPIDGSVNKLLDYCFANTDITEVAIPESITTVANNAFSRCKKLISVHLPANLEILDATCFAWCENLASIELPDTLREIRTYAFDGCKLETVTIPASVNTIMDHAFGSMTSLKEVTFEKKLDANGNIIAPYIHKNAFYGSGNINFVINVPWSEDYDYNYTEKVKDPITGVESTVVINPAETGWGAANFTINYNYEEA